MLFYVDESGIFANPANKPHAISALAVLGIPDSAYVGLVHALRDLTMSWGSFGRELKGSQLAEEQVGQVLDRSTIGETPVASIPVALGLDEPSGRPRPRLTEPVWDP